MGSQRAPASQQGAEDARSRQARERAAGSPLEARAPAPAGEGLGGLLAIQRTAGNRAVQRLVQREGDDQSWWDKAWGGYKKNEGIKDDPNQSAWDSYNQWNNAVTGKTDQAKMMSGAENWLDEKVAAGNKAQEDWAAKQGDGIWGSVARGLTTVNTTMSNVGEGLLVGGAQAGLGILNTVAHPIDAAVGVGEMAVGQMKPYGDLAGNLVSVATGDKTLEDTGKDFMKDEADTPVAHMADPFIKDAGKGNYGKAVGRGLGMLGVGALAGGAGGEVGAVEGGLGEVGSEADALAGAKPPAAGAPPVAEPLPAAPAPVEPVPAPAPAVEPPPVPEPVPPSGEPGLPVFKRNPAQPFDPRVEPPPGPEFPKPAEPPPDVEPPTLKEPPAGPKPARLPGEPDADFEPPTPRVDDLPVFKRTPEPLDPRVESPNLPEPEPQPAPNPDAEPPTLREPPAGPQPPRGPDKVIGDPNVEPGAPTERVPDTQVGGPDGFDMNPPDTLNEGDLGVKTEREGPFTQPPSPEPPTLRDPGTQPGLGGGTKPGLGPNEPGTLDAPPEPEPAEAPNKPFSQRKTGVPDGEEPPPSNEGFDEWFKKMGEKQAQQPEPTVDELLEGLGKRDFSQPFKPIDPNVQPTVDELLEGLLKR